MSGELKGRPVSSFAFHDFLLWTAGIGACLVILMAGLAFGPSGLGFVAVIALISFALMIKRYRFSLRTFLIVTTLFGLWLGFKVGHDIRLRR
ncbi:MAG TPA: hypothetical protein VHE81_20855, partial [Lacipirellulaceae bacterium]|nr:hypothetical protein [Lacipirellulaceae bacterium]